MEVNSIKFIERQEIKKLVNPRIVSKQLLNGENNAGQRATVTEGHCGYACQEKR